MDQIELIVKEVMEDTLIKIVIKTQSKKKYKTCEFEGCQTRPTFRDKDSLLLGGSRCFKHKLPGYVSIPKNRKRVLCEITDCSSRAIFGVDGTEKNATRCGKHKIDGQCSNRRTCEFNGCTTTPTYCGINEKKPMRCSPHKYDEDIRLATKQNCEYPGCSKWPSFRRGDKKGPAIRCLKHKLAGDVTVNKLCEFEGCKSRPTFAPQNILHITSITSVRCGKHKIDGDKRRF